MARLKNDPGITKTNNEPIMTKPHWVDCNKKWLRNFNGYCLIVMFRFKSCSLRKNFLLSLVGERERGNPPTILLFHRLQEFFKMFSKIWSKQNIYFLRKGRLPESKVVLSELFNCPLLFNSPCMSVVWAYVSLWLCMFGCLLQGPIRLKVLWVDGSIGTNEILAYQTWHCLRSNRDTVRPLSWFCTIFSSFIKAKGV